MENLLPGIPRIGGVRAMGVLRANNPQGYRCGSSVRYKSVPVELGKASIGRRVHEQRGPAGRQTARSPIATNAQHKTDAHAAERGSAEASCAAPGTQDGAAASNTDTDCDIETSGEQSWWDELPGKYKILAASSVAFVICNMDKVNMSVAIIPMASDFGWGPSVAGLVQSSFFWGYFLCQIPGGYFSSRFSGSRVLPTGVGLWSLATAAVPILSSSVSGLCFSRSLVGLGEAVSPAAATDMVARLMPKEERSRAVAFIFSGLHFGSLIGLLLSPFLIENFGWQSVFTSFGVLGLAWVVWFESVVSEVEEREPGLAKGLMEIRQVRMQGTDSAPVPWRAMVRARPVQALMFTHFCSNWFQFTMLAWLPTYLSDTLGVSLTNAAELALLPPIVAITISAIAGPSADTLISRGWKTATVRKLAQCIAFLGPLVCLTGASLSDDGVWNVALISSALGLASFSLAGLYCNHQDLSPKYSAFLLGITNTAGALPGILGVPFTGLLLDYTDSWPLALFLPSMFFFLAGSIVFTRYGRAELAEFNDNRRFDIEDKVQGWFRQLQK